VVSLDELAATELAELTPRPVVVTGPAGGGEVPIARVTHDSGSVGRGALFACLRGAHFDGHDFAGRAASAGAVALLVDHELPADASGGLPQLVVDDTRLALGPLAAAVAGHPSRLLKTVGITGTNGKTTTAAMAAAILEANGWRTGVLGTLAGARTTPEAPELQQRLAGFLRDGCRAAVLEVSSHALALHRIDGTSFDVVAFTNLGRDHLDLHGSPEEYFRAKARLFSTRFAPLAIVNVDDPHGRLLADSLARSDDAPAVVEVRGAELSEIEVGPARHAYRWRGERVDVPIGGDFNVANSHAALAIATELGVPAGTAIEGLRRMPPIPGRFEPVAAAAERGFTVVVDYAHTPDGLAEVLAAARRAVAPPAAVIAVFGCGGERDQEKRPEMADVAATLADRVFVTSDNPRREDPEAIVREIVAGVPERYRARVTSNTDRRAAIAEAIGAARRGDIVVIAGKGHETTQDLGDRTIEFDDRVVARSILEDLS
jgi:UDP-N-acetylmuramoyl-L-alanyl-D-glutamate--2,6-diaminopimelate ligase